MEEKERYKIHRYTLQGNEKISFNDYAEHICEHYDFGFEKIEPFNQRIQDLLNQQDKRIKELEQDKTKFMDLLNSMTENWWVSYEKNKKLRQENKQLKQQLAEKEKEIRKKVCDDVIKFMEEDGFDCSDWLDLFNLISGSN